MDFIGLILSLPIISSNTKSSLYSNEYRSEKPFDDGGGDTLFGRCVIPGAGGAGGGTG